MEGLEIWYVTDIEKLEDEIEQWKMLERWDPNQTSG